jgi:hypothetical protein
LLIHLAETSVLSPQFRTDFVGILSQNRGITGRYLGRLRTHRAFGVFPSSCAFRYLHPLVFLSILSTLISVSIGMLHSFAIKTVCLDGTSSFRSKFVINVELQFDIHFVSAAWVPNKGYLFIVTKELTLVEGHTVVTRCENNVSGWVGSAHGRV